MVAREVVAGDTIATAGMKVGLFEQDHGVTRSLGLRIGSFGYSTDVVGLDDAAFAALEGVDTWVVGCFLREGHHRTHANLATVLGWAARIKPRRTVLTHMGTSMDWRWLAENLPSDVEPGHDGMILELT
jgi:phosphoribosyl 1,2-cyclic phosphate phosphodiesterase